VHCLVIGATGYVGARLVPRLLADGHAVRVLVRDPAKLALLRWAGDVDARTGDVTDPDAVRGACAGVDAVVLLVHSMDGPGFAQRERRAAEVVAAATAAAGVRRTVYLGGLQPEGPGTSEHLASRRATGEVLLAGPVPTAVLQAGIVVGAGSASFEMIRHLAVLGPVLPLPDHAWNLVQPIGVDDLLHHLATAVTLPPAVHGAFDVGGADVLAYRELVTVFAEVAGRVRPLVVPLPVSAPRLTARAVAALTPVGRALAAPLLESMAHDLVAHGDPPTGTPPGGPVPYAEAVRRALAEEGAAGRVPTDPRRPAHHLEHTEEVAAPAAALWAVVAAGDLDRWTVPGLRTLLGGRAGGPRPARLAPGAALGFWRVERVEPGRVLELRADAALPGSLRCVLRVEDAGPDRSRYVQRVSFRPRGPAGVLWWLGARPALDFSFAVLARTVAGLTRSPAPG
jgi:uncharacterized protein YbjT (DUF2867 family)